MRQRTFPQRIPNAVVSSVLMSSQVPPKVSADKHLLHLSMWQATMEPHLLLRKSYLRQDLHLWFNIIIMFQYYIQACMLTTRRFRVYKTQEGNHVGPHFSGHKMATGSQKMTGGSYKITSCLEPSHIATQLGGHFQALQELS